MTTNIYFAGVESLSREASESGGLTAGDGLTPLSSSIISEYLSRLLPAHSIKTHGDFWLEHLATVISLEASSPKTTPHLLDQTARALAACRIPTHMKKNLRETPLPREVDYEKRNILKKGGRTFGLLYEGFSYQRALFDLLPPEERSLSHLHIVISDQLIGTWDENDLRYHARVVVFGFPSVISLPGIVEAPAKPREYYLRRQLGVPEHAISDEFKGRIVEHGDRRIPEILKGYIMQAVFYHMTGDPFCPDPGCRLFNAHWQEEMLHAQVESPYEFCASHERMLRRSDP